MMSFFWTSVPTLPDAVLLRMTFVRAQVFLHRILFGCWPDIRPCALLHMRDDGGTHVIFIQDITFCGDHMIICAKCRHMSLLMHGLSNKANCKECFLEMDCCWSLLCAPAHAPHSWQCSGVQLLVHLLCACSLCMPKSMQCRLHLSPLLELSSMAVATFF